MTRALWRDASFFFRQFPKALKVRLLGMDLGQKTIGLALSDVERGIASPLQLLERKGFSKDAALLQGILQQHGIGGLVIGYPLHMNADFSKGCQRVESFCQAFCKILPNIPILLWDERLSSEAANGILLEADLSRAKRKGLIDKMAAVYILQGALDFNRHLK